MSPTKQIDHPVAKETFAASAKPETVVSKPPRPSQEAYEQAFKAMENVLIRHEERMKLWR